MIQALVDQRRSRPNECGQADITHTRHVDGTDTETLLSLADYSRFLLSNEATGSPCRNCPGGPVMLPPLRVAEPRPTQGAAHTAGSEPVL